MNFPETADPSITSLFKAAIAPAIAADLRAPLLAYLDHAQAERVRDPSMAWAQLMRLTLIWGLRDVERAGCLFALRYGLAGQLPRFWLCRCLIEMGARAEAARYLPPPRAPHEPLNALALEIVLQRVSLNSDDPATAQEIQNMCAALTADPDWVEDRHNRVVDWLVVRGAFDPARRLVGYWLERGGPASIALADAALLVGDYGFADRVYRDQVWPMLNARADQVIGGLPSAFVDYDPSIERAIAAKIEAAQAPEDLDRDAPPETTDPPPRARLALLAFESWAGAENDVARHFIESAREADVDLHFLCDNVAGAPHYFAGDDQAAEARVAEIEQWLARVRPEILLFEAILPMGLRGISPHHLVAWRARYGFELVVYFRDAGEDLSEQLRRWAALADSLVTFDPMSPLLRGDLAEHAEKTLLLPVPVFHSMFLEHRRRDPGTLFVGAINWRPRRPLLASLLAHGAPLRAVFGPARHLALPTMTEYARALTRARAVMNIARHGMNRFLVTGRVFEAIAAGACLIEQDNPATEHFFVPWRHYLAWRDPNELAQLIEFVAQRPDLAGKVADAAHRHGRGHFAPKAIWRRIIAHARRPASSRAPLDLSVGFDLHQFGDKTRVSEFDRLAQTQGLLQPG